MKCTRQLTLSGCGMLVLFASLTVATNAAEMQTVRNQAYVKEGGRSQQLDVYAPMPKQKDLPVVVWIHGGGWRKGDKAGVQQKPQAFTDQGYVFVSVNYRLFPEVSLKTMTGDVAAAIRWVHEHAAEYGGDPDRLIVMGHSAGAHLAALVCTDESYLKAQGLSFEILKGCVPFDTAVYDAVKQVESVTPVQPARARVYQEAFGDAKSQRDLSPVAHVAPKKNIPPFLILHIDRADAREQSQLLAKVLKENGIPAEVFAANDKTHGGISVDFGTPNDKVTETVFQWLKALQGK